MRFCSKSRHSFAKAVPSMESDGEGEALIMVLWPGCSCSRHPTFEHQQLANILQSEISMLFQAYVII